MTKNQNFHSTNLASTDKKNLFKLLESRTCNPKFSKLSKINPEMESINLKHAHHSSKFKIEPLLLNKSKSLWEGHIYKAN